MAATTQSSGSFSGAGHFDDRSAQESLGVGPRADADIGVWQCSGWNNGIVCDEVAARHLGLSFTNSTMTRSDFFGLFHTNDRADLSLRLDLCAELGAPLNKELIVTREGEQCLLVVTARRGHASSREPLLLGTVHHVQLGNRSCAGQKDINCDQEQARDLLALALDGAGAGTWELSFENGFRLKLSRSALRIYGLPADHCGILNAEEWEALIEPESLAQAKNQLVNFSNHDQPQQAEFKINHSGAQERWLRIHGRAILSDDRKIRKVVGLVYDDSARKQVEEELRENAESLRLTQEAAGIGTFTSLPDGYTTGSAQFYRNLGLPAATLSIDQEARRKLIHPEDRERVIRDMRRAIRHGINMTETEYRIIRADNNETRWILARMRIEQGQKGHPMRLVGAHLDVTDAKIAALKLQEALILNEGIVESSPDCIKVLDLDGTLRFMSQRGLQTMEVSDADSVLGTLWQDLWPADERPIVLKALASARRGKIGHFNGGGVTQRGNHMWLDAIVTPLRNGRGKVTQLLAITRDMSEIRAQSERVRWAAEHDALTGLPNRHYFDRELDKALDAASKSGGMVGLLALDVDSFKQVNDSYGHDAGDKLLKTIAQRVQSELPEGAFIARVGGDEFAIVLSDLVGTGNLLEWANEILKRMEVPVVHQNCLIDCRASVGASLFPLHGNTRDAVMKSADTALYAAKTSERNKVVLFVEQMRCELDEKNAMVAAVKQALDLDKIFPFYQPKVCLQTGCTIGFEALLRWRDQSGTVRSAGEIQSIFEDRDLARRISDRMQNRIVRDVAHWLERGLNFGSVAVNAAAAEFNRNDFASRFLSQIDAANISPEHFQIEVTETVLLGQGAGHVREALLALKGRGIQIALDDFGTGYASLTHLKTYPVDIIKIDRSFVTDLPEDAGNKAIVCALLALAADMGMTVVAEGVENEVQRDFLRDHGCDLGQGYFFSPAVSAQQVSGL